MDPITMLIKVVLAPLGVAVIGIAASLFFTPPGNRRWWFASNAVIAGLLFSVHLMSGWPPFPPKSFIQWIPYFAIVAVIWGGIETIRGAFVLKSVGRLLVFAGLFRLILKSRVEYSWTVNQSVIWLAGLALIAVVTWLLISWVAIRMERRLLHLVLTGWIGGAAACMGATGSISLAQTTGALAVALLPVFLLALSSKEQRLDIVFGLAFSFLAYPLMVTSYFYSETPWYVVVLLLSLPLLLCLGWNFASVRHMRRLKASIVAAIFAFLPLMAAVALAIYEGVIKKTV